jgi:tripartite-type tricarboxylate transporter receptor subunit TctC
MTGSFLMKFVSAIVITLALLAGASSSASAALNAKQFLTRNRGNPAVPTAPEAGYGRYFGCPRA